MKKFILLILILLTIGMIFAQVPQGTSSSIPGQTPTCVDTDSSMNPDSYGSVTIDQGVFNDSCINQGTVREYYCANGQIGNTQISCPVGKSCVQGACIYTLGQSQNNLTGQQQSNQTQNVVIPPDPVYVQSTQSQNNILTDPITLACCGGFILIAIIMGAILYTRR